MLVTKWVHFLWYGPKFASVWGFPLWPLSWLYRLAIALRYQLYRLKWLKTTKFPVPLIVVGNVTVGGTGKTPLVIELACFLKAHGYRPGIVSRGYRSQVSRDRHQVVEVDANSEPHFVGDEPVLIARRTGCPVVVGVNRVAAVRRLLDHAVCDVVISDDGLQHYALERDVEIVVVDGQRRFGNQRLLPAGPLREPLTRLDQVDFIVCHGGMAQEGEDRVSTPMRLLPGALYQLVNPKKTMSLADASRFSWHAIAGIGYPERFFDQLEQWGLTVQRHSFPDHHPFAAKELFFEDENLIIMTEKDACKCLSFATERFWCLPVSADLSQKFKEAILTRLKVFC